MFWPLSGIYYLLPIKLLLLISILYVTISIINKIHKILSLLMLTFLSIMIFIPDSGFIKTNLHPKLISWNVARNTTTSEDILDFVNEHKAETFVFIEFDSEKRSEAKKNNLDKLLPKYDLHLLSGNMAILTKSGSEVAKLDSLTDSYNNFNILECDNILYAIVDIGSWPLYNRAKPFGMLKNLIAKYGVDIICGDFNTPYGSILFRDIFKNYNCGNTDMMNGRDTWPSCFPIVSLDHIFVSKKYKINSYMPITNCKTDHYPLEVNYK